MVNRGTVTIARGGGEDEADLCDTAEYKKSPGSSSGNSHGKFRSGYFCLLSST